MSHKLNISDVTIGGDASNNPVPLTITNYDLTPAEQKLIYQQLNVIAFHTGIGVNLQVTGIVQVDPSTGEPMVNDNDPVRLPCPPFCYL